MTIDWIEHCTMMEVDGVKQRERGMSEEDMVGHC